ncbi:hypothetical protein [Calothrix sp. PCC 7507]|uniref:hypothetical protein n=1 Tax=Calothrix sp. PCC 7507 TaxID=99598 RepID=UPI00029F1A2E|nr:hypothetical protein [Calothrix sp. PCC 7507]AFY32121.1 hypothetical protein Cal7507_1663 [Calothrix sp. PCC 7507]
MSVITISDLDSIREEQLLTELNIWEMSNIEGGRRRRRRGSTSEVNTSGILSKDQINQTVNQWLDNVDIQIADLREQLSG